MARIFTVIGIFALIAVGGLVGAAIEHFRFGEPNSSVLMAGTRILSEQTKLLAAKVVRDDKQFVDVVKTFGPFTTNVGIVVSFRTEYSFGFDLQPDKFEVRQGAGSIEIVVDKPKLISAPSVLQQSYQEFGGSVFINSPAQVNQLYQNLPLVTMNIGKAMASSPDVVALCEKQLIAFLKAFLKKQPGVRMVPNIEIVYK